MATSNVLGAVPAPTQLCLECLLIRDSYANPPHKGAYPKGTYFRMTFAISGMVFVAYSLRRRDGASVGKGAGYRL
jgi:hypothetical protein